MQTWLFNQTPLLIGPEFPQPTEDDFPSLCFKNADRNYVLQNTSPYVRSVIEAIPLQRNHKFVLVDVKVHDIEPGKYPCIPGWHTDSVVDPRHPTKPEVHTLFVTGSASLTEFIAEPIQLDMPIEGNALLDLFRAQIENLKPAIRKIPSCRPTTYGRYDFHRGSVGLASEKRLLVRVSESDLIRPQNKPQEFFTR